MKEEEDEAFMLDIALIMLVMLVELSLLGAIILKH